MTPIFNARSLHRGWLDGNNVFDPSWRWIAFLHADNIYSATSLHWLGSLNEGSVRDRSGKPVAWLEGASPTRGVAPPPPGAAPQKPVTPFVTQRSPVPRPPPIPLTPLGGWSPLDWEEWLSQ
jgi:hypothetical protein